MEIPSIKDQPNFDKPLKPVEAASTAAKIAELLSGEEGKGNSVSLDAYMQSQLNPLATDIMKMCLPNGLLVPFPTNVSCFLLIILKSWLIWNSLILFCRHFLSW